MISLSKVTRGQHCHRVALRISHTIVRCSCVPLEDCLRCFEKKRNPSGRSAFISCVTILTNIWYPLSTTSRKKTSIFYFLFELLSIFYQSNANNANLRHKAPTTPTSHAHEYNVKICQLTSGKHVLPTVTFLNGMLRADCLRILVL